MQRNYRRITARRDRAIGQQQDCLDLHRRAGFVAIDRRKRYARQRAPKHRPRLRRNDGQ
jgi:hypothetical protein